MSDQITIEGLQSFVFEKVLNEDPVAKSVTLLGTFARGTFGPTSDNAAASGIERLSAIVRVEKSALEVNSAKRVFGNGNDDLGLVRRIDVVEHTDIYPWMLGWFEEGRDKDVIIRIVCPATEVHIRKYTAQDMVMVRETPELYERIVKPYIEAFPPARTQWVTDLLAGVSEADSVLYSDSSFLILPDMKWDRTTISMLYLLAIARDKNIRSLRDLRKGRGHLELLQRIRDEGTRVVKERYGLGKDGVRIFVHYQPSYYQFHVHIVNANQAGWMGMAVGQAHLLDDIISLLEIEPEEGPGIFERMTLTYGLGDQHGLYELLSGEEQWTHSM